MGHRNKALDGIRGLLALIVMLNHIAPVDWTTPIAHMAVIGFFVLSGMVLAPTYESYGAFLGRRAVRLLPMYLLCVGAAFAFSPNPDWSTFFWFQQPNPPAWSLVYEMAAMVLFPAILWLKNRPVVTLAIVAGCALSGVAPIALLGVTIAAFVVGVNLSGKPVKGTILESCQFLGRISYPLYLTHFPILMMMPASLPVKIITVFVVSYLLTLTVERWSIEASRNLQIKRATWIS